MVKFKMLMIVSVVLLFGCIVEVTEGYEKSIVNKTSSGLSILFYRKNNTDTLLKKLEPNEEYVLVKEYGEAGGVGIESIDSSHYLASDSILVYIGNDSIITFYAQHIQNENSNAIKYSDSRSFYGAGWSVEEVKDKKSVVTFVKYTFDE